jgi:hypothetical protein
MVSLHVFYNSFQILCAINKHPASYMTRDITTLLTPFSALVLDNNRRCPQDASQRKAA